MLLLCVSLALFVQKSAAWIQPRSHLCLLTWLSRPQPAASSPHQPRLVWDSTSRGGVPPLVGEKKNGFQNQGAQPQCFKPLSLLFPVLNKQSILSAPWIRVSAELMKPCRCRWLSAARASLCSAGWFPPLLRIHSRLLVCCPLTDLLSIWMLHLYWE